MPRLITLMFTEVSYTFGHERVYARFDSSSKL